METTYHVQPVYGKQGVHHDIIAHVPGSKSITNRALLIAAMAEGTSHLKGALFSDDSRYFLSSLQSLGFAAEAKEESGEVTITGLGGKLPKTQAEIYVGSAGTAARFLTALLGLSKGEYVIQASEQMKKRPMDSLFSALASLGAKISYQERDGFLPVRIGNEMLTKADVTIDIEKSSQFLSALLIAAPLFPEGLTVTVQGKHGMAYIEMTVKMMEQFGVFVERPKENIFVIKKGQKYRAMDYRIEPDVSAACYFYAMAPLLGRRVQVAHVHAPSLQGDMAFLSVLEAMGAEYTEEEQGIVMEGSGTLHGVCADLSCCSDQTMTLAAIAPFADSETVISGISHIRYQESNRILALKTELNRMGIACEETEHGLKIGTGMPKAAELETYDDHRMAMAFSLTGLRAEGIVLKNPNCCAKTFAGYFQEFERVLGL